MVILIFALIFYIILVAVFDDLNQDKINNYTSKFNSHLKRKTHDFINKHNIDAGAVQQILVSELKNDINNIAINNGTEFESYDDIKYTYLSKSVGWNTYRDILGKDNKPKGHYIYSYTKPGKFEYLTGYFWIVPFIFLIFTV